MLKKILLFFVGMGILFSVDAQTYDLYGPEQKNRTTRSEIAFSAEKGSIRVKMGEIEVDGTINRFESVIIEETKQINEKTIQKSYLRNILYSDQVFGGERSIEVDTGALVGLQVIFKKAGDHWTVPLIKEYREEVQKELKEEALSLEVQLDDNFYPKAVKIGDSWELRDEELTKMLGILEGNIKGTAQLTLVEVRDVGEEQIAIIDLNLKARGVMIEENTPVSSDIKLSGTIERSLSTYVDRVTKGPGKMILSIPIKEENAKVIMDLDLNFEARESVLD